MKKLCIASIFCFIFSFPSYAITYELDPEFCFVEFNISRYEISQVRGRFNAIHGNLEFDEQYPEKSKIDIIVKATSVDTNNSRRDNHLMGPDFLNVKQYPLITFKGLLVTPLRYHQYRVTGQMGFHGVTKPMTVIFTKTGETTDQWGVTRVAGKAVFYIKRSDYGMKYMLGPIGDEVNIVLYFEAIKKTI